MTIDNRQIQVALKAAKTSTLWILSYSVKKNKTMWGKAKAFCNLISCKLEKSTTCSSVGDTIYVSDLSKLSSKYEFFREVGHILLNHTSNVNITLEEKESESDLFSKTICEFIWPEYIEDIQKLSKHKSL